MKEKYNFLKALAVFAGTIIGAGIFGLPYVTLKAGFFVVIIYFFVLAAIAIIVHSLLGEIARNTEKTARIPGYAEEYLGKKAKNFTFIVSTLGLMGALLAYLILGGHFFYLFFSSLFGGTEIFYTLIFFGAGAFLIFKGRKDIAQFELAMLLFFIILLFIFFFHSFDFIDLKNFTAFDFSYLTFPYGMVLFSLWGLALVPEASEMVNGDKKKLRQVIISGIIFSAICYIFFIFIILGASGINTSPDAISGFIRDTGGGAAKLGFIFGLITTFTSFITLGLTLKKIFWYDLKLPERTSWFIACFTPLILYFAGFKNFINVISLTGAVMIGLEAIIVIFIYKAFIQKKFRRQAGFWIYPLVALFLIGIFLELFYYFKQ